MMGRLLSLPFCVLLSAGCATVATAPGSAPPSFTEQRSAQAGLPYLLFLPDGYGSRPGPWPMILFLHGAGERGDQAGAVKRQGLPAMLPYWREFPFIVACPQCPRDGWWGPEDVTPLLDEIAARYAVDPDRVYLTGLSMGGYGAWSLACAHPERFAAVVPVCGGGNSQLGCRLKHVPVWAFHGAADSLIPLHESLEMVQAVKDCGGQAKFTVYHLTGHDAWNQAYRNPELYQWLLAQRRYHEADGASSKPAR